MPCGALAAAPRAISTRCSLVRRGTYESLARKDEMMTTAAMVTHVYDQIDQARTELNAVSKYEI
jgi:hypothetical protein